MNKSSGDATSIGYHVLVSLGDGPKHGYAMMREISERTEGGVRILPGTLYSTLKRLLADDLVTECAPPAGETSTDARRRYYRLTSKGRRAAMQETDRMAMLVRIARAKGLTSS